MNDHPTTTARIMDSMMPHHIVGADGSNGGGGVGSNSGFDSESCKNTPFVVRKLDAHHRALRMHTGGTQSAQSSPLPHRRLDKLEGVIRDKPPVASGVVAAGNGFRFGEASNSPLISRKFFMDQPAAQASCNCPSGNGAFFSPLVTRKNQTSNGLEVSESSSPHHLSSPLRYRRRVDSDTSRQSGSSYNMTKSDYSASDMSLMRRTDDFLLGGGGPHSPVRSVLGEPGVFASPARTIPNQGRPKEKKMKGSIASNSVEGPMSNGGEPDQSIVSGWLKFRDNKRWKIRWGVVTKLSPAAEPRPEYPPLHLYETEWLQVEVELHCLHLQLYRDSKDRYKHGQTKASLSLQQFLGVESGFTLDKESNTVAIICQDVTVVLAFDTRERLIQWQVKIAHNLGEDIQYLILVSSAPPKSKIATGPARIHIHDHRFCLTTGVPPKLSGLWEIGHLRRYGVIDNRFCFEGGTNCGKGEGLYVMVTDQGNDITQTLRAAAQGKLASKRRPVARKISEMDSPRRSSHRGADEDGNIGPCPSLSSRASYWDVDSNFGCGDTVSVSETLDCINDSDVIYPSQTVASIERCTSCFSKLGAPSMSRSSTGIGTQYGYGQQQVWAINSASAMEAPAASSCGHKNNQNNAVAVDRMSLCSSQGSSSNNSDYSIAKLSTVGLDLWNANKDSTKTCTCSNGGALTLRKNGLVCTVCDGSAPVKPKTGQKPPIPLPITTQLQPTQNNIGAYENYDFPKMHPTMQFGDNSGMENYDTPKKIHDYILASESSQHVAAAAAPVVNTTDYSNYDMPAAIVGQMCSCLHMGGGGQKDETPLGGRKDCACNRVMSWADNWICRRGNSVENTGIAVNKLRLTGEGRMPIVQMNNPQQQQSLGGDPKQSELYATVDVSKKIKSRLVDTSTLKRCECSSNYINIDPSQNQTTFDSSNYANLSYAHSLDNYENAKEVSRRASQLIAADEKQSGADSDLSVCGKCGHMCTEQAQDGKRPGPDQKPVNPNYLVMEPKLVIQADVPGYLPMSPANTLSDQQVTQRPVVHRAITVHVSNDKSASNPSIHLLTSGQGKQLETSSENAYDSNTLKNTNARAGKVHPLPSPSSQQLSMRARSASADSSRFLEDTENFESSETLCKASSNSIHESRRMSSPGIHPETDTTCITVETEDEVSVSFTQSNPTNNSVNIRRSESVPCKAQNRDSSSSNDSGVSTGSLKQRSKDFETLDLSGGSMVLKKHRNSLPCTHVTLPRRSKSSDPLKELSFRFRKNRIPEKSTSAEAEIPICPPKAAAYGSQADGQSMTSTAPYIDSRSTSSGTSDMSDYIETLSMSSHSSSDVPDASRLNRPSTSTLRPRSGKEYQNIDRSLLGLSQQGTGNYANITPVPENAESPSPGYQSSSPPYSQMY